MHPVPDNERVCHCFGYSAADIREDFLANGRSTLLVKILAAKALGECECADKNPKGR